MKKITLFLLTVFSVLAVASTALATSILYDWQINVNGTTNWASGIYEAPEVGGDITAVSGFSTFTFINGSYSYIGPEALGSVTVTLDPDAAGDYTIWAYLDVEIDEWNNGYTNETGSVAGDGADGMVDGESSSGGAAYGIYVITGAPLISGNTIHIVWGGNGGDGGDGSDGDDGLNAIGPGSDGSAGSPGSAYGDIAFFVDYSNFSLDADQYAMATFTFTDLLPSTSDYLSQTDDATGETVYLISSLKIETGDLPFNPIPEPSTMILFAMGLLGLARMSGRRSS